MDGRHTKNVNKNKSKKEYKNNSIGKEKEIFNQNIVDSNINIPVVSDIHIITTSLDDSSTLIPDSKDNLATDPDNPYYIPHACNTLQEEIQPAAIEPNFDSSSPYEIKEEIKIGDMRLTNSNLNLKEIKNSRKNYNKERDKSYDRNSSCQSCKECSVL